MKTAHIKIARIYDKVAETYNQGLSFDILSKSNAKALELTKNQLKQLNSILSLGIGDGLYLNDYVKNYPLAKIHGLDISKNMLEKAKARFNCETTQGDARFAGTLIKNKAFDLIHAHFIIAYVPFSDLLKQCNSLLAPGGMVSIASNTHQSFPRLRALLCKFETSLNPFNRFVAQYSNETVAKVNVPYDKEDFARTLQAHGYLLKESVVEVMPIVLNTEEEVFDFFISGGWFVSALEHPLISEAMSRRIIKHLISKHISLPYQDVMYVVVGVAQKK